MCSKTTLDSPLSGVATDIEERRCNLIGRHGELRNKITVMESSIPALMAYNMWMTGRNCHNASYCKVQEIMKKFLPQPGPADKLLREINSMVNNLYQETAQLHVDTSLMQDKIINADVELEEAGMELESLELANKELEHNLTELQRQVQRHKTPSLHSIHSEDLICLKKIRQLAEEELKLKTRIKQLEDKEDMYRRQVNKLLFCRELQRGGKRTAAECTRRVESDSKELQQCSLDVYKHTMTKQIYALKDKEKRVCCPCTTSITLTDCEETSRDATKAREKLCPLLPCCVSLDIHASRIAASKSRARENKMCCKYCRQISSTKLRSWVNRPCEFPLSTASGVPQLSTKQIIQSSASCEPDKSCNECETAAACKHINSCECDCEGTCARKLPALPCDYSVKSLNETYQSTEKDDSNSNEEFCECCSCGGESSGNSLT